MKIQRLTVENFKSFDRLDLELGDFNVFIGANASGKSNVLHALEFLRDIAASGLRNAVSMQGDVEFFQNVGIGEKRETSVEVDFRVDLGRAVEGKGSIVGYRTSESAYFLKVGCSSGEYNIIEDRLSRVLEAIELETQENKVEEKRGLGKSEYSVINKKGVISSRHDLGSKEDVLPVLPSLNEGEIEIDLSEALLGTPFFEYPIPFMRGGFGQVSIYDFDTRAQRKAAPITGKSELEEDGSNIALVLKNLLENEEKRRRFTNLIQYVLPFVSGVEVERFAGRSLIPMLEETHAPGTRLPASLLSEGTIKVIALLIALYFEDKPVIAFEEPASNLHPKLVSRVVEMMKEQSKEKQIFVTTHSPEVIKHAGLENVYLVARDENGFSTVTKPAEKKEVRIFLENEMGIDDLFVQGLLEA